jgi:acetyl-CoA synthetase
LSYEDVFDAHRWNVPAQYNIAQDVCEKHPPAQLAMLWESFDGSTRELSWGELQDLSNRAAHLLASAGVKRGDRVAVVFGPTPQAAAIFFGVWKLGAVLLSMSVLYGDDAIQYRLSDSQARVLVVEPGAVNRFEPMGTPLVVVDDEALASMPADFVGCETSADEPAQLFYTSGTTGRAKGIVHAHRYLLGHEEFVYCHEVQDGERFHGMGEWAWAAGIAPLLGPWRLGAVQCVYRREAGFDPHRQLEFLSRYQVTNVFTTPTAMRSMMTIADARTRYPQVFRRVCSAGEPLNPEAIRWFRDQYGVTVLDYYGLTESYPLVANYPFMDVREGSMGRPMPGYDVQILDEDERPVAQGERGEICLRARSNPHYPLGYWRRPEDSKEVFDGDWFHTKDAASQDENGYFWYEGRADDVIIAAGYRIGPFEVESACLEHPAVREAAAVASPDSLRGQVVKAFVVLSDGFEASDELADEIKRFVRERLSAYAYPRIVEFVPDLPKTLTGKIRRIELRQLEAERAATHQSSQARATGGMRQAPPRACAREADARGGKSQRHADNGRQRDSRLRLSSLVRAAEAAGWRAAAAARPGQGSGQPRAGRGYTDVPDVRKPPERHRFP